MKSRSIDANDKHSAPLHNSVHVVQKFPEKYSSRLDQTGKFTIDHTAAARSIQSSLHQNRNFVSKRFTLCEELHDFYLKMNPILARIAID
jgi:hypothetical protein